MNTRMLIAALVVTTFVMCQQTHAQAQDDPQFALEIDLELIQGTWEAESYVLSGVQDEHGISDGCLRRFEGNRRYLRNEGDENWVSFGTFSLNPSAMPAEIDIDTEAGILLGIYEIDGDLLKFCIGIPGQFELGTRPDRFESTEDYPTVLVVLRRVEEDDE